MTSFIQVSYCSSQNDQIAHSINQFYENDFDSEGLSKTKEVVTAKTTEKAAPENAPTVSMDNSKLVPQFVVTGQGASSSKTNDAVANEDDLAYLDDDDEVDYLEALRASENRKKVRLCGLVPN